MARAVGLLSGGLDSVLAARILMDQGIQLIGICFISPFFGSERAERAAAQLGIPLLVKDITEEMVEIVRRPLHGRGSALNPCIDCHALMIRKAGELMESERMDFVFTGEVLNERPMSQTRESLSLVAKLSSYGDYLLRPLSARLLPETRMESAGLVHRNRLLDLHGRSRRRQLELARSYGLTEFAPPGGGCVLTEKGYAPRLKDLLEQGNFDRRDLRLLRLGRHFRLGSAKLIVGRNREENEEIRKWAREGDILLYARSVPGPLALLYGKVSTEQLVQAAAICASFADLPSEGGLSEIMVQGGEGGRIQPPRLTPEQIQQFRL